MKFATWDENLANHTPEVQAAARVLEDVIRTELPDVVVHYDPGNGLLAFGRSMKMGDLLFALIPHAGSVNLQLAHGALLPNPDGLIEGTGKQIRHIKVHTPERARSNPVRDAIRAQIARKPSRRTGLGLGLDDLRLVMPTEPRTEVPVGEQRLRPPRSSSRADRMDVRCHRRS